MSSSEACKLAAAAISSNNSSNSNSSCSSGNVSILFISIYSFYLIFIFLNEKNTHSKSQRVTKKIIIWWNTAILLFNREFGTYLGRLFWYKNNRRLRRRKKGWSIFQCPFKRQIRLCFIYMCELVAKDKEKYQRLNLGSSIQVMPTLIGLLLLKRKGRNQITLTHMHPMHLASSMGSEWSLLTFGWLPCYLFV